MKTVNQVQTGDTITGTSTSKSYININSYKSEKGWECPRCGRINAPWVRQCDCSPSTYTSYDKITINPCDEWWKTKITCDDTFKIHPESITYTTNVNKVAGGSDYKDSTSAAGDWTNVPHTYANTIKGELT